MLLAAPDKDENAFPSPTPLLPGERKKGNESFLEQNFSTP
jgi:hypothetical protein